LAHEQPKFGTYRIFVSTCWWGDANATQTYMGFTRHPNLCCNWYDQNNAIHAAKEVRRSNPDAEGQLSVRYKKADGGWETVWQEAPEQRVGRMLIYYGGKPWEDSSGIKRTGWYIHGKITEYTADRPKGADRFANVQEVIGLIREAHPNAPEMTIVSVDDPTVIYWRENNEQGADMSDVDSGDLNQPLLIPRETLIGILQEKLDAEVADREAAAAKLVADREALTEAILALSEDVITNLVASALGGYSTAKTLEKVEEIAKDESKSGWVSSVAKPNTAETKLGKLVRVLTAATSTTDVEVKTTDSIYPLL